jgi:acyl-CoA synthetase (AMP-forming)/AMP-acid ligase II
MSFENEFGIEEVWAAIAAPGEVNESELRAFCYKVLPASVVPRHFIRLAEIPVNSMGKVDRPRLAELLRPHRAAGPRA